MKRLPGAVNRSDFTQPEKAAGFRRAFDVISAHRKVGNDLAAYVVAFSVFEDRVTAAVVLAGDLAGAPRPRGHVPLFKRIERLMGGGHIDEPTSGDWREAGNERNALIHSAMWSVDVFTPAHVDAAVKRARAADALARKLGRKAKKLAKAK